MDRGAAAILQPDAGVCGGITEWRRIAALAAAHDIPVAPHWLADLHVHLVGSTPNATWVEYFPDFSVLNLGMLFLDRAGGRPGRPGPAEHSRPRHRARRNRRSPLLSRRLGLGTTITR